MKSRLSCWQDEHENLLAELLSSDSDKAKETPKEKHEDEERKAQ